MIVVWLQTWPRLAGLRAQSLESSGPGSNPDSSAYLGPESIYVSKPKFSYPGTASPQQMISSVINGNSRIIILVGTGSVTGDSAQVTL